MFSYRKLHCTVSEFREIISVVSLTLDVQFTWATFFMATCRWGEDDFEWRAHTVKQLPIIVLFIVAFMLDILFCFFFVQNSET
jgi:hypothetical protein